MILFSLYKMFDIKKTYYVINTTSVVENKLLYIQEIHSPVYPINVNCEASIPYT